MCVCLSMSHETEQIVRNLLAIWAVKISFGVVICNDIQHARTHTHTEHQQWNVCIDKIAAGLGFEFYLIISIQFTCTFAHRQDFTNPKEIHNNKRFERIFYIILGALLLNKERERGGAGGVNTPNKTKFPAYRHIINARWFNSFISVAYDEIDFHHHRSRFSRSEMEEWSSKLDLFRVEQCDSETSERHRQMSSRSSLSLALFLSLTISIPTNQN